MINTPLIKTNAADFLFSFTMWRKDTFEGKAARDQTLVTGGVVGFARKPSFRSVCAQHQSVWPPFDVVRLLFVLYVSVLRIILSVGLYVIQFISNMFKVKTNRNNRRTLFSHIQCADGTRGVPPLLQLFNFLPMLGSWGGCLSLSQPHVGEGRVHPWMSHQFIGTLLKGTLVVP